MNTKQRMTVCLLGLTLIFSGLAMAAREGRLIGKIIDEDGKPIQGVTVTATSPDIPEFRQVETTDKKGIFKLDFERRFVTYHFRFVKEGFLTLESDQQWELEGTTRGEFTMYPGQSVSGPAPVQSASSQAVAAYNEGVRAYNAKDYATAEKKFQEAVGEDPDLHQGWEALAKIHLKQEQYGESVDAAEQAIALGSTQESVWRTRWEAYRGLGDEAKTAEALEDMKKAGLRTESAEKLHNQAVALAKSGDNEGAFAKFEEALSVDPNLRSAMVGVATTGILVGRDAEAVAAAENILRADPGNERALRVRYNAYLNLKDDVNLFDALLGLLPIEPQVALQGLSHLAFTAYDAQDQDVAKERFVKILEVAPDQAPPHYYLGLILMGDGERDLAKTHFERFLELAPDAPEATIAKELVTRLGDS